MNVVDLNDTVIPAKASPSNDAGSPVAVYTPDELTQLRFQNLAIVGKALMQVQDGNRYQTDFYLAKQALEKFIELYNRLELDPQSREGMDQLIAYLQKKIDRRLNASIQTSGTN